MGNTIQQPNGKGIIVRIEHDKLEDGDTFQDHLLKNHETWEVYEIGADTPEADKLYYSENHLEFGDDEEEKRVYAAFSEEINNRYPMKNVEEDYEDELREAEIDGDPQFDRHDIARNIQLTVGLKLLIQDFYESYEEVIKLHPKTPLRNLIASPEQAKDHWNQKGTVAKHNSIKDVIEKNYRGKELIAAVCDPCFRLDYFPVDKQGWPKKFEKELLPKEFDAETAYNRFERTVKQRANEVYRGYKKAILANPEIPVSMIITQEKSAARENE